MKEKSELKRLLGGNIKRLRLSRNWGVVGLADSAGVAFSSVSHIEIGRLLPNVYTLHRIACALGVTIDQLMQEPNGKDETR